MTFQTQLVTIGASATALPAPAEFGLVRRIYIEPLRANTHPAYIGTSAVTNDGSGTEARVVSLKTLMVGATAMPTELATPPASTVGKDSFSFEDPSARNTMDPTKIYVHGTNGEKLQVTYTQE